MALTDIPKRFPLATLFGSLILVGVAGGVATGSDFANQLMSTIASAVVSMALLLGFIPDLARWRAPAVSTVRLAAGVVAVGALAAICSVVVSPSGTSFFAYGDRSIASAWEAFGVGALICAATGVFEEALFRGLLVTCLYNQLIILNGDIVKENASGSRKTIPPMASAALMGSVLFALLHVVGSPPDCCRRGTRGVHRRHADRSEVTPGGNVRILYDGAHGENGFRVASRHRSYGVRSAVFRPCSHCERVPAGNACYGQLWRSRRSCAFDGGLGAPLP